MARVKKRKLRLMVSSTVYGIEPILDQIHAILENFGYEVWMSHAGTLPVDPGVSAFESCINAVRECDIFMGMITNHYGSGKDGPDSLSITHQELDEAIALNKPRWILAHSDVVMARRLLIDLGYKDCDARKGLALKKGASVIDDLKLIDMYEAATREDLKLKDRTGNWVQKYQTKDDILRYIDRQFSAVERNRLLVDRFNNNGGEN